MPANDRVTMEGMRIIFRNFAGRAGQYNAEGSRNFGVILDDDVAEAMLQDGWNVKRLRPREDDDGKMEEGQAWLPVAVAYANRPPRIYLVTSRSKTPIGEDLVEILDYADVLTVDLIVNPYNYTVNGKSGVKAYLHSMYVNIDEDALTIKYQDVPISGGPKKPLAIEAGDDIIDAEIVEED